MKIGKRPARILLYEQVVEDLCLLIDRGDFEPGDQLPSERELIEKLNVSRNVLREAFHVLESRGVIVSHQGKGRFLRESPISGKEKRYDSLSKNLECYSMIEAYEVRQALEEKAVELIIKNASEKDIDELEEALQKKRYMKQIKYFCRTIIMRHGDREKTDCTDTTPPGFPLKDTVNHRDRGEYSSQRAFRSH